jgi:hypothetical protein
MFASTSAVQQMIGASELTDASPVSMPDVLGAEDRAQGEELLGDERLDRRGVERRAASASAAKCAATRPSTCPEPVGVASTTLLPSKSSIAASSWWDRGSRPAPASRS